MSRTELQHDARDLSLMLAERIGEVADELGIKVEHKTRKVLVCFAPWDQHHNPKLEINISGTPGKWNDWVGGKFGDAYDLVACVLGNGDKDRKAAYPWALKFLGLSGVGTSAEWEKQRDLARRRAKEREERQAKKLIERRHKAHAEWLAAGDIQVRDYAWRYLEARGIDLHKLPRRPRAIRLSMAERWLDPKTGEIAHVGPALMSAMTLPDGSFGALHRTWINPDRPGEKADISPARKMWPDSSGSVIRLWRGATDLPERQANERGVREDIVACEGVEDGLSIALMAPELRVVAVGSLPGLLAYRPPPCAQRVLVAADNDWGKPQAQALLDRAIKRLTDEQGMAVRVIRSPEGKDFNDLLRGVA